MKGNNHPNEIVLSLDKHSCQGWHYSLGCNEQPLSSCCMALFVLLPLTAGLHGPFQKDRPTSGGTPPAAGLPELFGYLPVQMVGLLRVLQQQLGAALEAGGLEQQQLEVVQGCQQVWWWVLFTSVGVGWSFS